MDTNAVTYDRPARAGDYGYAMSNDDFDSYRYSAFVTRVLPDGDLMVDLHGAGRRWQLNPKGFTIDPSAFWCGASPDEPEYQAELAKVVERMAKSTSLLIIDHEEADQKQAYLATCVEAVNSFNSRSTEYRLEAVSDGEYLQVMGTNNDFKSVFGDVDANHILEILKSDDYEPFSVLLKASPQIAKDWACWAYSQAHPELRCCNRTIVC